MGLMARVSERRGVESAAVPFRCGQSAAGEAKCPNKVTLAAGCVAAVTAATATFPLETVRRRMMMGSKYKNTLDGAWQRFGTVGGGTAQIRRVLHHALACRDRVCGGSS